eukprot:5544797-Lingulodinium_polyedra.AAC.1
MDPKGLEFLIRMHSSASRVLSRDDSREALRLVEVVKEFLWSKAKALVRECNGRPILYSYGSDGTPLLTQESVGLHIAPKAILYRRAKESGEYLVERAFLLAHKPGGDGFYKACLLREPRHLAEGKTALHSFRAATDFFPMLRKLGHEG